MWWQRGKPRRPLEERARGEWSKIQCLLRILGRAGKVCRRRIPSYVVTLEGRLSERLASLVANSH